MSRNGISILDEVERDIVYYEEQGQTVVLAAMNGMHSSRCSYSVLFYYANSFCLSCYVALFLQPCICSSS